MTQKNLHIDRRLQIIMRKPILFVKFVIYISNLYKMEHILIYLKYCFGYIHDRSLIIPRCFHYAADVLRIFMLLYRKVIRKEKIVEKFTII